MVDRILDRLIALAVVAGLGALSYWLWPEGLLSRPLGSLTLAAILRAFCSVAVGALTALALFFIAQDVYRDFKR